MAIACAKDLFAFLRKESKGLANLEPQLVLRVKELLDGVTAESFGVRPKDVSRRIGYQEVYDGPDMTCCIFLLPKGAKLPLHDHPGMCVVGRLLFGRMRTISYDLVQPEGGNPAPRLGAPRRVRLESDVVHGGEPMTFDLEPDRGNLHEIEALEDSAFFDILLPPYDWEGNRECTYYERFADPQTGDLVVVPTMPTGFFTESKPYKGPVF